MVLLLVLWLWLFGVEGGESCCGFIVGMFEEDREVGSCCCWMEW